MTEISPRIGNEGVAEPMAALPPLPTDITNEEIIVRALKTPAHYDFKKSKLKHSAYRPRPGTRILSAARAIVGMNECKKNIRSNDTRNEYIGFGAIYAASIRSCGSSITDDPKDYFGHAHIEHNVDAPIQDEPNFAEKNEEYIPLLKALADRTKAYIDPTIEAETWGGPPEVNPPPLALN